VDAQSIRDIFAGFGPVAIRRMFGGHGIFSDGLMFALEADGELYLKADDASEPAFSEAGSRPFVYTTKGRSVTMRYWRAPEAALDDPEVMAAWAREAFRAARAAASGKAKGRKPSIGRGEHRNRD
jgi:DNA transformation protein